MLHIASRSSRPATFRQFTRKNYAVFNSLKREVRIGVLSITALTYANTGSISAAPVQKTETGDTLREYALREATVTGTRAPLAASQAARIVQTITRKEIEQSAAQSVNDLLKQTAGVDVRQRGGFGVQTDISVDGGTFDQITILLNGVSINNPHTGHLSADFPVGVDDIERIEILEGAAGRVFGSQAFSGAINIVTRSEGESNVAAHADAGSYGTLQGGASLNLHSKNWQNRISADYSRSDGGTANSDFQMGRAFYRGGYRDETIRLNWQAGASVKDYGANTFYSAAYPNQWEANRRYLFSVTGETQGTVHLLPTLSWIRSQDHFQLIRDTHTSENFHRTDVFTAGLSAWTDWRLGRTSLGAEVRHEGILSTNLGRPMNEDQYVKIHSQKDLYYNHRDNRTNMSFFVEHNIQLEHWTFSLGVLANRNTALDERLRWYPGVDISWRPGHEWKLFASWNKALRLPTFTDLYYKSPTQEGNTGLHPEETQAFKLGAQWLKPWADITVQGHYTRGKGMIDWVMYTSDDIYHSTNFRLDNYGFSVRGNLRPRALLGENFFIEKVSAQYAYIYQKRHDDVEIFKSNYALEYLRHKLVLGLDHRIWRNLTASWSLRWQQRMGSYLLYKDNKSTGVATDYAPYALLDAKVQWTEPRYTLYVSANNLTSHRYYDLGNILQPGIWWMAGVKVNFKL